MKLNEIKDNEGARHRKMRVGRGIGSSKGKTAGRGGKGQTARTGVAINGFEGGQTPIHRRLPKRGFTNYMRHEYSTLNTGDLQTAVDVGKLDAKKAIDLAALKASGLMRSSAVDVKLLAKGAITAKLTITVDAISAAAKAAVEKSGGSVTLIEKPPAPAKKADKNADKKASA